MQRVDETLSDAAVLHVVIPTFNRAESLTRTLVALSRQIDKQTRVTVIDNASTDDTEAAVQRVIAEHPGVAISYLRNRVNIGAGANVLRCFETVETDWVWILGDDDRVLPNAIEVIRANLTQHGDAICINFTSELLELAGAVRAGTVAVRGLPELVEAVDFFGNLLFLSTNVYHRSALLAWIRTGYLHTSTYGPHVAMLFAALRANPAAAVVLSPSRIVAWTRPDGDEQWETAPVFAGLVSLALFADSNESRSVLLEKIRFMHSFGATAGFREALRQVVRPPGRLAEQIQYFGTLARISSVYRLKLLRVLLLSLIADHGGRWLVRRIARVTGCGKAAMSDESCATAFEQALNSSRL